MAKRKTSRLTIPYAPIAKSPPCSFKPWLIKITIKQDARFIMKGDIPMAKELRTIFLRSLKMPLWKCNSSFGLLNTLNCQSKAKNCAKTVAVAAPRMPHPNTKINSGASNTLITTVETVAIMAFLGCPAARNVAFNPMYRWVTILPANIICIKSLAYPMVCSLAPKK